MLAPGNSEPAMSRMIQQPEPSLEKDLDLLASHKQVLVESMEFLRHMEELLASLETVVVMGNKVSRIPVEIQAFIAELDPQIQQAPAPQLRADLEVLDEKVRLHVEEIVAIAGRLKAPDAGKPVPRLDHKAPLLRNFHRYTRTAVSLRALLFRRGLTVEALVLPLAEGILRQHVTELEREENRARDRVEEDIGSFRGEINRIAARPDLSSAMRERLMTVNETLGDTLRHLRDGKTIEDLPVHIEELEITAPPGPGRERPLPVAASETEAGEEVPDSDPGGTLSSPPGLPAEEEPGGEERGLLGTLWTYLTTPPKVNWKQSRTYRRPGR